jgi:ribose 5-phosphate isomerase A
MVVGLGTGSTAIHAVPSLAARLKTGELRDICAIPTSFQSLMLARQLGIPLVDLDQIERIDIAIDGADEVAPDLTLIKGAGAAQTRRRSSPRSPTTSPWWSTSRSWSIASGRRCRCRSRCSRSPWARSPAPSSDWGEPILRMAVKKAGPVVTDQEIS